MCPKNKAGNNLARFLIGLFLFCIFGLIALITLFFLTPVLLSSFMVFVIIFGFIDLIVLVASVIAFIWYLTRDEPPIGKKTNYSIKQGTEI
ncbi:hypothetical protein GF362_07450 [Candidatus Dojkabacteria bacterium]|nr:hypothetical protein [Candidatus Dojkabacteria bacterium]